ncbi:hypothetical protein ACHAW5_011241 [Stephanodiscus triporus]|uniref:N-acetyltransferase domain-containing protein n=1 Tax=Stephanodiscus triporus TaxID=2934178 RepID=A0ABD3PNS2_9STRA
MGIQECNLATLPENYNSNFLVNHECNLATLPENYNSNFLVNHVRAWPELSLVAEHVPEGWEEGEGEEGGGEDDDCHYRNDDEYGGRSSSTRITPLGEYWKCEGLRLQRRRRSDGGDGRPRREIVGYVLGKVEERPQRREYPPSRVAPPYDDEETTLLRYLNDGNNPNDGRVRFPSPRGQQQQQQQRNWRHRHPPPPPPPPRERLGHVTSLAVRSHARRLGIASSLLRQLHYHLRECHGADSVGLHVRVSNEAAVRLYCAEGYNVADIMPLYYGD